MNIRAVALFVAFAFAALPAHAQRHDDGDQDNDRHAQAQRHGDDGNDDRHAGLASAFAALTTRVSALDRQVATLQGQVAKLEGQITADDLVGTYTVTAFATEMFTPAVTTQGPSFGLNGAAIALGVVVGTATVAADFTGSFNVTNTNNNLGYNSIVQSVPAWNLVPNNNNSAGNFTWTYANGTVALSNGMSFSVAAGGRLLIFANSSNPNTHRGDSLLLILTRLQ